VTGRTALGAGCEVFPCASIGHSPQDTKCRGEDTRLIIGDDTVVGELVTLSPGTENGRKVTKIGSHCILMPSSHVGHDCVLGDYVTLDVGVQLAGYVSVGDYSFLGSLTAVHQFVRIGAYAETSQGAGITADIIPFGVASGNGRTASLTGLNLVGLRRQGFPDEEVHELRQAYRLLFAQEGRLRERLADVVRMFGANPLVSRVVNFIESGTNRQLCVRGSVIDGGSVL
jgi:UDP-N-acetylglucosamine acyltransferase